MAAKPVVFVIGASGKIGLATVQSLSSKYADQLDIRAGVRNPAKADKLKVLQGVTVVQATQGDGKLVETFAGVTALFIVTPPSENRAELAIKTAEAAKKAGVKHLVAVSVPIATLTIGKQFTQLEETISTMGVPYTIIRLPFFIDNYIEFNFETIQKMSTIITPVDPTKPYVTVAAIDGGRAAAAILADVSTHVNKTYTIVSDRHSYGDLAKVFSEALGKEVTITNITYEDVEKAMLAVGTLEPWQVEGLLEIYKAIDSGSPSVAQQNQSDFKDITGEEPTSLKDWVVNLVPLFK